MDNLTHTAIGIFLARVGPGRWSPGATAAVIIGANLPDIDVVSALGGGLGYMHYHRHLTHSLLAMPFIALLSVAIVRYGGRKPVAWFGAFFAALLAVASHLALDWTNTYGIRLLLPFSGQWLHGDTTYVADLWIWAACAIALAAPFLGGLVGSEITSGAVRSGPHGRGWAWFALLFLLVYDGARVALHSRAVAAFSSHLYQESVPVRVFAIPDPISPLKWRGLVETADSWIVQDANLAAIDPGAARAAIYHKPDPEPAIDAARQAPGFQEFINFSQCPLWRVTAYSGRDDARLVEIFDLRFGTPRDPGFTVFAAVDNHNRIIDTGLRFGPLSRFTSRKN